MFDILGWKMRRRKRECVSNAVTRESRQLDLVVARMAMVESEAVDLLRRASGKQLLSISVKRRKRRK
jgi:hypothetical protein